MTKLKNFLKFFSATRRRLILSLLGLLLIGFIGWRWWRGEPSTATIVTATPATVTQIVSLVGTVVPAEEGELGFDVSGRIASVPAPAGARVVAGELLVTLDLGTLPAQLESAIATFKLTEAETRSTTVNLTQIRQEQDTLAESAYRQLLSTGLVAVPQNNDYGVAAPTITGRYNGPEGTYKVLIRSKATSVNDYELRTFGVEETGLREISDTEPTPLGTHGLFITFPEALTNYQDTVWYVVIPNTTSVNYAANYNAYEEAKRTRERTLAEAAANLSRSGGSTAVKEAEQSRALAEVNRIQAEIALRTLRSPLSGVVTTQDARPGEIVTAGAVITRVISADDFEIEVRIPETDVAKLEIGDAGKLALDAYGESREYPVAVRRIDPGEVVVEGVPTYKGVLIFTASTTPGSVKSGMTANVNVVTAEKEGALAIPVRALVYKNGQAAVELVKDDEGRQTETRQVAVGLEGSNGLIEIVSGLASGDHVLVKTE